jgi:protein TonB
MIGGIMSMKKVFRGFFCLFLSLMFHSLILSILFTDISMLPVQSAPQEQTRIIAEVVLFSTPESQAEKPNGQKNNANNTEMFQTKEESKMEPQITPEAANLDLPQKIPEATKAPEPKKDIAKKQDNPAKKTVLSKNTAENRTQENREINADNNVADTSNNKDGGISPSSSGASSLESGNVEMAISQSNGVSPIVGVDSVIVVNRVKPIYPQISRKRGEEGSVVLLANVLNGKVVNVSIEKSSGIKALDSSALSAVGKWSFSSDTSIIVRIPVSFKLKD